MMVERGFILSLDPDEYPLHAELAAKLDRDHAWAVREPKAPKPKPKIEPKSGPNGPKDGDILPHQARVIEKLQKSHGGSPK